MIRLNRILSALRMVVKVLEKGFHGQLSDQQLVEDWIVLPLPLARRPLCMKKSDRTLLGSRIT